ncbi:MAG: hypothetical protein UZ17_ACD001000995 [Acidobacteria bacterium OLB17]|nr:MAG: hypothetical protein UZ17_ACD001000995 [Acidobacteria bacterium OLB17]MCZ2391076.1 YbjP/YqhG family protein [Acidobacteriota bacterium]
MLLRNPNKTSGFACIARPWRRRVLLGVLLCVATVVTARSVEAQSPPTVTAPGDQVTKFYKWALAAMAKKRSPIDQRRTVASYLSKSLYRWLYTRADRETRNLYFLASNDWLESWIGEIEIVDSKVADARAVVKVDLGKADSPDDFVDHLQIRLTLEKGVWKIDCIQNADESLGGTPEFDPEVDPPGCRKK